MYLAVAVDAAAAAKLTSVENFILHLKKMSAYSKMKENNPRSSSFTYLFCLLEVT